MLLLYDTFLKKNGVLRNQSISIQWAKAGGAYLGEGEEEAHTAGGVEGSVNLVNDLVHARVALQREKITLYIKCRVGRRWSIKKQKKRIWIFKNNHK